MTLGVFLILLLYATDFDTVHCDTAQLRQTILESAEKVYAWQIDYDLVSPEMKPGDKVIHRNVALRYPDCLFHWTGNTTYQSRRSSQEDILQQRTIVAANKCYWDFPMRRASKSWECDSRSLIPGSLPRELLWDVLIWWPFTSESNHLLSPDSYTVEDVLRDQAYQFMEFKDQVGTHPCFVLRCEGKGALWFDCENPAIMRKREWYQRDENSIWRAELFDHQEFEANTFCPRKISWTAFRKNSTNEREEPTNEFSALIIAANFNDSVPKELFDIPEPLPGHVVSRDEEYQQIRAGANDYADSILQWTKEHAGRTGRSRIFSRVELAFHLGVYCFGALLFFGGIRSWWRSRKQTAAKEFFLQSIREESTDVSN